MERYEAFWTQNYVFFALFIWLNLSLFKVTSYLIIGKSFCTNAFQGNKHLWNASHLEEPFAFFGSSYDLNDLSCLQFKATAFPFAPYTTRDMTKIGNDQYGGFEVN